MTIGVPMIGDGLHWTCCVDERGAHRCTMGLAANARQAFELCQSDGPGHYDVQVVGPSGAIIDLIDVMVLPDGSGERRRAR